MRVCSTYLTHTLDYKVIIVVLIRHALKFGNSDEDTRYYAEYINTYLAYKITTHIQT